VQRNFLARRNFLAERNLRDGRNLLAERNLRGGRYVRAGRYLSVVRNLPWCGLRERRFVSLRAEVVFRVRYLGRRRTSQHLHHEQQRF
jgi:hypothetical protein